MRQDEGSMPGILLVEDDPGDQKLIKAAISATRQSVEVRSVETAEEAVESLRLGSSSGTRGALPDLILLDLNMPGMGGRQFLQRMKGDETLGRIPVVVLTSSQSERDITDSYRLHASGYLHKPSSLLELKDLMSGLLQYWFVLCKLPHKELPSIG